MNHMNDVYVKFYVKAVRSGMVADMGADLWQTLTVLASYMDKNGECWPTQWQIAHDLGVARETANRRLRRLSKYRWKGEPVIEMIRRRDVETQTWDSTLYRILPASNITIFRGK